MSIDDKLIAEYNETYVRNLEKCVENWDVEEAHEDADDELCDLLIQLGFRPVVEKYREVFRFFS